MMDDLIYFISEKMDIISSISNKLEGNSNEKSSASINKTDLQNLIHDFMTNSDISNVMIYNENECSTYIKQYVITMYNSVNNIIKPSFTYSFNLEKEIDVLLGIRNAVIPPNYTNEDILEIQNIITYLNSLPQPEQRTPEWYEFRKNRITASDFASVANLNSYKSRHDLLLDKCGISEPFRGNAATIHGNKYEDVACSIYERRNNVSVSMYGCIPHPTIPWIGASPDGICNPSSKDKNYIGRMLEIKCPKSRKLNGFVPEHYLPQVQGQLEVCELEFCDFLECVIKEYKTKEDFYTDYITDKNHINYDNHNYTSDNNEKGVIVELYDTSEKKLYYKYCSLSVSSSRESIEKWEEEQIDAVLENTQSNNLEYLATTYWRLNDCSCILVKRDKNYWDNLCAKLEEFWNELQSYKINGHQPLLDKKNKRKKNKTSNTEFYKDNVQEIMKIMTNN